MPQAKTRIALVFLLLASFTAQGYVSTDGKIYYRFGARPTIARAASGQNPGDQLLPLDVLRAGLVDAAFRAKPFEKEVWVLRTNEPFARVSQKEREEVEARVERFLEKAFSLGEAHDERPYLIAAGSDEESLLRN